MKKAVFVTGAASGTGYAIAERFAKEGYGVFISSRRVDESASKAAESISKKYGVFAKGYTTKIYDEEDVKRIFKDIDTTEYFVSTIVLNAANFGMGQNTLSVDIEDFMDVYRTNVGWNFMLVRQAALRMKENRGGAIVFITSNTACRSVKNRCAYSSSKSAIMGMSRSLAFDLGEYGIRSNCVVPGMIKTKRWQENQNSIQSSVLNCTPIGDIAEFEDIANAVWYLGSDQSRNTTGAELIVDGGNSSQLIPDVTRWNIGIRE